MVSSHLIGVLFAVSSAIVWGTSDFSGGVATRRNNQFQVLILTNLTGVAILIMVAIFKEEPTLSLIDGIWAFAAGISGGMGLAILYRSLSLYHTAVVAPTSAVIGSALPVVFSYFSEGLPEGLKVGGIIIAVIGIWLVSQSGKIPGKIPRQGLLFGTLAGVGFGGYFILIAQMNRGAVFVPLVIAKSAGLALALLFTLIKRSKLPSLTGNPIALFAGMLDAGGNIFFLLAIQYTRLDIASLLASMYAAVTVVLAKILLKEVISGRQWIGILLCMTAIGLIVL